jgi:Trypsin-like peptidase domain
MEQPRGMLPPFPSDSLRRVIADVHAWRRRLTPVLFSYFPAIYMRLPLCQSGGDEDGVRLKIRESHKRKAAPSAALAAVLLGGLVLACAFVPLAIRPAEAQTTSTDNAGDAATSALCPVVYPDDETPASHGYHYTFFGNAFFINDEGYLLTVAHVVETFRDGGQAYILVSRPDAPARLLRVAVIAKDTQHDVAILRASPNPFAGKYSVSFVALSPEPAVRGQGVLALSLHPRRLQNAQSFEAQSEDSSPGTVLSYESTQLEKTGPAADVFLLSHPVVKGQSGSPVLALDSHAAVGLVEGLWLRDTPLPLAKSARMPTGTPGAAIPIRYAIALLQKQGIAWHTAAPSAPAPSSPVTSQSSADRPNP